MSRVEIIGNATLHLGNALDVLPTIAAADLVCSDPPYRVSKGGFASNLQLEGGFGGWMKDYGNQGDIVECDIEFADWMPAVFAALGERAHAYFMSNGRNVKDMQSAAEGAGFRFHTLLVWDKRTALPNKYYQNVTEFGLFMFKGKARTINDPASKNLVTIFQRDESAHPTEKPVELMRLWIGNSSSVGDTVLDPFMGSGTTGVAALQINRSFVGIEKDARWFDIACRRIEDAQRQGSLFQEQAA
jgi:site-specific DNA-methyltransferase (adenine-specific)